MKKILLLIAVLVTIQIVQAQNVDKKWAIGLGGGYYHNLDAWDSDGIAAEAYFSRYLSKSFDLMAELDLGWMFADLKNSTYSSDNVNLLLNLRYKFNNGKFLPVDSKIQPFIFAGPGFLVDNGYQNVNFDAGLGVKYMLSKSWSLFAQGGYTYGIKTFFRNEDRHDNFLRAVVGIEWAFSTKIDKDKDGVSDFKDKCPGTPRDIKVDKVGCPLDADGDGVPDSNDKCPDVKGLAAFEGCPDTDGDGIADKDDDCPEVKGIAEFKGCPDTDGDGIMDGKDDCPTVKGTKEFKGCPDSDGDGIKDSEDKCPTVAGLKKFDGCPDTDGDGVADKDDACPDTPADSKVDAKGCPQEEDMDSWIKNQKVNSIFFDTNKSEITPDSKERMDKLVKLMKSKPAVKVTASGFADPRGATDANKQLSLNRAKAAAQYLQSNGIAKDRVSTQALGEENSDKEKSLTDPELQNSRRVDFNLHK